MIGRKTENKILVSNSVQTRPEQGNFEKVSKKIEKIINPLPSNIFRHNGMRSNVKKENSNFSSEFRSYSTWAIKFRKKKGKKIQKIIKPLNGIIFSQNGMRYVEKVKTKFYSRIPFIHNPGKKIPKKNSKKIQKIIKSLPYIIFSQNRIR